MKHRSATTQSQRRSPAEEIAVIPALDEARQRAAEVDAVHLAIGIFDGVHVGHQAIIRSAVHLARHRGGVAAVLTFHPHPSRLFRPDAPTPMLLSPGQKRERMEALGVDWLIEQPFEAEFAAIEAERFLPHLVERLPNLKSVVVGENFRFGKGRKGEPELMLKQGPDLGARVYIAKSVQRNDLPVSSTRIRRDLAAGNIVHVNGLLGAHYESEGRVQPGRRLGREIGFPTLNLPWAPEARPRLGVYAVRVRRADGATTQPGVANYGLRPTVSENEHEPLLEVHVIGDTDLDEGDEIVVQWMHFLRDERKFESVDALKQQIAADKAEAARLLNA